ncbi:MAG: flippase, partial [Anaerolineae bacterium]|nr:flippase [Anaerolineae bacterium]
MDASIRSPLSAAQTIARNTIFLIGGQAALRISSFLFNILVIRQLGDAVFGQYSVVMAWAGLFSVLGDLGVTQYFTREVARNPERSDELFWDVAAMRFMLAIVASVVTVGGAVLRAYPDEIIIAVGLYTMTYFLQAILAPLTSMIAGNERLDIVSVVMVIGQVVFMVFGAVVLFSGGGLIALVAVSFINLPLMIALSLFSVRRFKMSTPKIHLRPGTWTSLLRVGVPFAFIQLMLTFNFQIDTIILEYFQPFEVVGWYNASYNLTRSLLTITSAIIIALPLTMAREHAKDPNAVRPWYYRTVKFMGFLGLPLAVGGMLLSDQIIHLLYGDAYAPSFLIFAIIVWDTPILMFTSLCGNLTTAIKREHSAMFVYAAVGGFNLIANLVMIPRYGVLAAAVTTIGSDLVGAALFYLLFRRAFGAGLNLKSWIRLAISAALMGVLIAALRGLPVY